MVRTRKWWECGSTRDWCGWPSSPREREPVLRRMYVIYLVFCLRFIVNEKPFNLEKMTSNVLSVLLINLWDSSRSWNSSPIEMDIVYVNERNFYERTKFLWTMVLFKEKPNDALQTWIVQRNDKRMFSKSFFKIQKKTKRVQINFFFVFQPIFLALK